MFVDCCLWLISSLSCVNLDKQDAENGSSDHMVRRTYSTSAPATTNCLLGNFEVRIVQI